MYAKIRTARNADLQRILEIFARSGLDRGKGLSIEEAEKILKKIETYPNYNVYVAEQDGEIVGVFELLIMDNLGHK